MAAGRAAATETEPPAQGTAGAQGSARRCGARQAARGRLCAEGTCAAGAASGEGWHARSEATRAGAALGRDGRARESQCRACCYGEQACVHARASLHTTLKKRIRAPSRAHSTHPQLCPALYLPLSRKHTNSTENMLLVTSTLLRATNTTRCPRSSSRPSSRHQLRSGRQSARVAARVGARARGRAAVTTLARPPDSRNGSGERRTLAMKSIW